MSQRLKACDRCCGRGQSFREQQQNLREQEAGGLACLCLARTHVADDGKLQKEMELRVARVSWNQCVCVCVCVCV